MSVARSGTLGVPLNGTNAGERLDPGYAWYDATAPSLSPAAIAGPPAIAPVGGPGDGPNLLEHQSSGFPFGAEQCKYDPSGEVPGVRLVQKEVRAESSPGVNPWPVGVQDEFAWAGIPSELGVFTVIVPATSHAGSPGFPGETYIWTISLASGCPLITLVATLDDVEVEDEFSIYLNTLTSITFSAEDGAAPYVYDISDGELPDGMSLDPGGELSGAATEVGDYTFTVRATDDNGCCGLRTYTLSVVYPPYRMIVNGAPISAGPGTPWVIQPGWSIVETANNRNTFSFEFFPFNNADARLALDEEIQWFEDTDLIFAGLVTNVPEAGWSGLTVDPISQKCTTGDYSAYADRETVTSDIPAGTVKAALIVLVALLAKYGVTLDPAQVDGIGLDVLSYTDKPVKAALDDIAKLAGNWVWQIDYYKVLLMFEPSATAAPVDVIDGNGVALGDITVEPAKTSYANRIIVTFSGNSSPLVAYAFLRCTTGNFANTETVTIGSKTYTFQATLTNVDGHVHLGATAEDSLNNLIAAITLGAGAGTDYAAAMTLHPDVTAFPGVTDGIATMRCQANEPGAAGNSIGVSTTSVDGFWFGEGLMALASLYRGADLTTLVNRVQADDVTDQDIGGTGANLRTRTIARPDISSAAVAQALADAELVASKATSSQIVRYRTYERGLHPGQTQTITVAARAITGTHLITDVTIRNTSGNRVERFVTTGAGTVLPRLWREVAQQMFSGGKVSGSPPAQLTAPPIDGEVVGPAASVDGEAALFDGTTGKLLRRATGTGVVHRASGVDSVSNVVESEITLADNTTDNVSTSAHGFAPKAPGDATKFLNGGNPPAWTVPGSIPNFDADTVAAAETQASGAAYADLATVGPSVTITLAGTVAFVWISGYASRAGTGNSAFAAVVVSGASTVAAADANAARGPAAINTGDVCLARLVKLTGLTPGSNTFKLQYRNDGGSTWTFHDRSIAVYAP